MHAAGFPDVSVTPDGGLTSGVVPTAQGEAFAVARYVCSVQYAIDPKYSQPLTDTDLGKLYDYYLSTLIPCIEANGFEIPDPPSRATFIDTYLDTAWNPYAQIDGFSQAQWDKLNQDCPQWPSGFYGF